MQKEFKGVQQETKTYHSRMSTGRRQDINLPSSEWLSTTLSSLHTWSFNSSYLHWLSNIVSSTTFHAWYLLITAHFCILAHSLVWCLLRCPTRINHHISIRIPTVLRRRTSTHGVRNHLDGGVCLVFLSKISHQHPFTLSQKWVLHWDYVLWMKKPRISILTPSSVSPLHQLL